MGPYKFIKDASAFHTAHNRVIVQDKQVWRTISNIEALAGTAESLIQPNTKTSIKYEV